MSLFRSLRERLGNIEDRSWLKFLLICISAIVVLSMLDVLGAWTRRYTLEVETASLPNQETQRKINLATERDRLLIEKERHELGLDKGANTQPLKDLGEIFLRVGPYAILFYSIAQAWKVFEDQRSSRLRLALSVCFSVIVVGFVLIVGGYVTPTALKFGVGSQQVEMTSESLGVVVVVLGAVMFLASLAALRARSSTTDSNEA